MTPSQPGEIEVTDQLERRIRKPVDLLRCTLSCIEIVALALAGIAASATTVGVETDIVGASRRLPHALLTLAPKLALFALFILPIALAVQLLVRRQPRRLAEALATGLLAGVVTAVVDIALRHGAATRLYDAIIMSRPGVSHVAALDPYLAGLVAYATMISLVGRRSWRNALWAAVGVYAVVHVGALHTTVLTLLITLIGGRAIGLAVRYVAGSTSQRPGGREIAVALAATGVPVTAILRTRPDEPDPARAGQRRLPPVRAGDGVGKPGRRRVRLGPAGGRRDLPDLPLGPGARPGVTQRPAVRGPRGRAPGAAVLRGRGRGRAHAAAARPGPGRPRGRRAGLRAPRGQPRWRSAIPAARTRSSGRSGTRWAACMPAGSPTAG